MNTRQEWLNNTDYTSQFYSSEETINEVKENFDIRRFYSAEGADVSVDGIECRVLVQYFTNPLNQAKYDRKLHIPMEINISTGSLVDYENAKWLVTGSIDDIQAYKSAGIVRCNNTLKYYDQNSILHQIPCIVESNVRFQDLRLEETKFITLPDDKITLRIAYSDITKNIKRDQIFKLFDDNYKVISVNKVTEPGLIVLKLEYEIQEQPEYSFSIEILNGSEIDIQENSTLQLNVNVLVNGELVSPTPNLTFTSNNELIANVNENGLVSVYDVIGSCVVTVSLESDSSVSKDININVIEDVKNNYTYEIIGNSEIIKGYLQNYIAKKYNNGILVEGAEFTFNVIPGTTPINAYTLSIIDGDQCSITANSSVYYITLRATDDSDGEIVEKNIKLKNLF